MMMALKVRRSTIAAQSLFSAPLAAANSALPHTRRLAWLDALRGLAAMVVVFEHALKPLWPEARLPIKAVFDPGWYGVLVFFLVSGYIVPASLERRGSVRAFWISRFFRLWPLFFVCVAGMALLTAVGWDGLHTWWGSRPVALALAHASMLQNLLYVPNLVNVLWTLSYEMAFYLLLTAMFTLGVHRRSTAAALAFAASAVLGAGLLPVTLLSAGGAGRMLTVVVVVTAVLAAGLAAVLRGGRRVRQVGAVAIAGTILLLLAVNQSYPGPWQGLFILATMFAGTALYRVETGQFGHRHIVWVALIPLAGLWLARAELASQLAIAAAWLTFAAGMALRHRTMPSWLTWLGLVSYSIYLLHPLLLESVEFFLPDPPAVPVAVRLTLLVAVYAVLLGLCALTWRWVELPAQLLGRRLISQAESRRAESSLVRAAGG
ncbi:acyltransferase family protein [Nonomuraea sp. NPDC050153]|uniref:acyltransferase family protein n=1 Tax=Nonomuraea sp. NPDC050153 TaxID=3364359 RepID=UPI0037958297